MKENFKEKKEELEEILNLLAIPRYTWRSSDWLLKTLEVVGAMISRDFYLQAKVNRARDLVKELNGGCCGRGSSNKQTNRLAEGSLFR